VKLNRTNLAWADAGMYAVLCAGAKVNPKATATLLPNLKDREQGAEVFKIMSTNLHDDKGAFEFLCPMQVRVIG